MNTTSATGPRPVWHGVNLGNWLLLERWIKPSLFDPAPDAVDEYSLCMTLGAKAEQHMRHHRETYIGDKDFKWLADYGINAVRIPYGYWLVEPEPPFVGGWEHLDRALDLCRRHGIAGVLDLHGAPGFQSPELHTGRKGHFQWHLDGSYQARTLDILEAVAQRYRNHPGMGAISILNEPGGKVPSPLLVEFFHQAYERVRKHIPASRAPVIVEAHPHFRLHEIHGRLQTLGCENVITDIHPYQAFNRHFNRLDLHEHLAAPMGETYRRIKEGQQAGPLMVGEWSLAISENEEVFGTLGENHRELARRAYAAAQLALYEYTAGWFFWTYKTETDERAIWSLRQCVARGWLPAKLVAAGAVRDDLAGGVQASNNGDSALTNKARTRLIKPAKANGKKRSSRKR